MKQLSVLVMMCGWFGLLGCSSSVDPIVGDERPFTIWGFMDAGADTQQVRVFTIEERLGLDRSGPIDAAVTSTDLDTGEQHAWRDAEVTFADGSVGHVFRAPFRAAFGHRYRLEVARSDGAVSSVEVTVPEAVELRLDNEMHATRYTARIIGAPPRLHRIEVEYDVTTVPPLNPWPPGSRPPEAYRLSVPLSYDGKQEPVDDGWQVEIDLHRDLPRIREVFEENCLTEDLIALTRMSFRFLAANEAWAPPGGVFDPEVLVEPGTFSNVENGYGFFGGGFSVSARWVPPLAAMQEVGYVYAAPCPDNPADTPECQLPPEPCFP